MRNQDFSRDLAELTDRSGAYSSVGRAMDF